MRRQVIADFAGAMDRKLDRNEYKSPWIDELPIFLYVRLTQELDELKEAIVERDYPKAADECVDVANFSMMLRARLAKERT